MPVSRSKTLYILDNLLHKFTPRFSLSITEGVLISIEGTWANTEISFLLSRTKVGFNTDLTVLSVMGDELLQSDPSSSWFFMVSSSSGLTAVQ